jgi:predicted DNA-binding transcriptional regulator AlpA
MAKRVRPAQTPEQQAERRRKRQERIAEELRQFGVPQYMTTRHLCQVFGYSRQGIKKLRDSGKLPPGVRIGQTVAWPVETIKALLATLPAA